MKFATFFRNLNLGRPNCPTRLQLEEAFLMGGATSASSFLTNGTLVFEAATSSDAWNVLALASSKLQTGCGTREPAFIRSVDYLAELVNLDPFALVDRTLVYECCASFLHGERTSLPPVPAQSKRGDVEIVSVTRVDVFSVSRKIGKSPGSPNAYLEKCLGVPATTRSWNTILRLVSKYA